MAPAELLEEAADGDFLRAVTEAVLASATRCNTATDRVSV